MLDHLMPLISSPWLYVIVFVGIAVDGFVPVLPAEPVVIGLGALSATGTPNVIALAAAVTAGGMTGDRISYVLGHTAGHRITTGRPAVARARAEQALGRHGGVAILIGRFLPYGRMATAVTSGSVSLPRGRFRLFTALAGVAWAAYTIGLGRLGGVTFAHSPLLGALVGMGLGLVLGGAHLIAGRRHVLGVPVYRPAGTAVQRPSVPAITSRVPVLSSLKRIRQVNWRSPAVLRTPAASHCADVGVAPVAVRRLPSCARALCSLSVRECSSQSETVVRANGSSSRPQTSAAGTMVATQAIQ